MTAMFTERLNLKDLEETLTRSPALLAVVGAGDFAREKLGARMLDRLDTLQSDLMGAPDQLRSLPERAQRWPDRVQAMLADAVSVAFTTYGELVERGRTVVGTLHDAAEQTADAAGVDDTADLVTPPVPPVEPTPQPPVHPSEDRAAADTGIGGGNETVPTGPTDPAAESAAAPTTRTRSGASKRSTAAKTTRTRATSQKARPPA